MYPKDISQFRTLTVGDLRNLLDDEDDDALVIFSADYGDYHHTPQALPLRGEVESVKLEASAYSTSGFRVLDEDEEQRRRERYGDEDDEGPDPDAVEAPTFLLIK